MDSRTDEWHRGGQRLPEGSRPVEQDQTHDTCPDCHAVVADLAAHEAWHSRLVADLANAVEKEIKRAAAASS